MIDHARVAALLHESGLEGDVVVSAELLSESGLVILSLKQDADLTAQLLKQLVDKLSAEEGVRRVGIEVAGTPSHGP